MRGIVQSYRATRWVLLLQATAILLLAGCGAEVDEVQDGAPALRGDNVCISQESTPEGCETPAEAPPVESIPTDDENATEAQSVENLVPACGRAITYQDGVPVISNGKYQGTGYSCGGCGHTFGCHFQCVNLATRYFYYFWRIGYTRWGVASAAQMCTTHPWNVRTYWRGSGYVPRHGDAMVFGGNSRNPWGHVAIVNYVKNGIAYVVEQNGSHSGRNAYYLSGASCFLRATTR